MKIVGIAGEAATRFDRLRTAGENGDAVPAFLPVPDGAVPRIADRRFRELLRRRLQLLKADDVRPGLCKPAEEDREPAIDAVDVEGGDLHGVADAVDGGVRVPVSPAMKFLNVTE